MASTSTTRKVPINHLPIAPNPLQHSLTPLTLQPTPSAQRRSTTFKSTSQGVWARVHPLWTAWPLRITKEEVEEMGVDMENGGQVNVEDVLARWDLKDVVEDPTEEGGLKTMTSKHRDKIRPELLGIAEKALEDCLPHLDVGDASTLVQGESSAEAQNKAREGLINVLSGRHVVVRGGEGGPAPTYGPWSTRYCGHQFGSWAGQLGDGRAISLLETESPERGRMEIQLKGSGRTPFSRTADGLAVLRSSVREFLGCEAVAALGISTTRSLAILTLPMEELPVIRENGPEPASVVARLAPTFIRIGHFEAMNPSGEARRFSQIFLGGRGWAQQESDDEDDDPLNGQGNLEGLRELTEWCKQVMGFEGSTKDWLLEVARRNAVTVAGWQVNGWMHGVLNTDNISILGQTIDYGPYAFMDIYDEGHICNHSDPSGLYSYRRQPERVLFALDKLLSALSPLIGYEEKHGVPSSGWSEGKTQDDVKEGERVTDETMQGWEETYWTTERKAESEGWYKRFGLRSEQETDKRDIIYDFLTLLHTHSMDFHASFRQLTGFDPTQAETDGYTRRFASNLIAEVTLNLRAEAVEPAIEETKHWLELYAKRVTQPDEVQSWKNDGEEDWVTKRKDSMESSNPRFVLRQWVLEELIADLEASGTENIQQGREKLARVLDMATNPFRAYNDAESEEGKERARLCGLGGKDMLGFQCSCSS